MYGQERNCICKMTQSSNCGFTLKAAKASSEGLRLDLGRVHFAVNTVGGLAAQLGHADTI